MAAKEICDRVKGKAGQPIELSIEKAPNIEIDVHFGKAPDGDVGST